MADARVLQPGQHGGHVRIDKRAPVFVEGRQRVRKAQHVPFSIKRAVGETAAVHRDHKPAHGRDLGVREFPDRALQLDALCEVCNGVAQPYAIGWIVLKCHSLGVSCAISKNLPA